MNDPLATDLPAHIDPAWRIGIVASRFHGTHVQSLVEGAKKFLVAAGIPIANIRLFEAPGSFEIPLIGAELAKQQSVDALLGFGIIVQGETHHAELLARTVAHGMMDIQVRFGIPFAFEVLYVDSLQQAEARTDGKHNKGEEAARAVLWSLAQLSAIRAS